MHTPLSSVISKILGERIPKDETQGRSGQYPRME